jgi:hypothetical protein
VVSATGSDVHDFDIVNTENGELRWMSDENGGQRVVNVVTTERSIN